MMTAALSLWLRQALVENTDALIELVASGDLLAVDDGDQFGVIRSHVNMVTRLEAGERPVMPMASA